MRRRKTVEELLNSPGAARAFEEEVLLGRAKAKIAELLEKQDLQQQDLAQKMGLTPGRVSQFLSGAENITLKTLAGIGQAIGYRFDLAAEPISPQDIHKTEEDPSPLVFRPMPRDRSGFKEDHFDDRAFSARVRQKG